MPISHSLLSIWPCCCFPGSFLSFFPIFWPPPGLPLMLSLLSVATSPLFRFLPQSVVQGRIPGFTLLLELFLVPSWQHSSLGSNCRAPSCSPLLIPTSFLYRPISPPPMAGLHQPLGLSVLSSPPGAAQRLIGLFCVGWTDTHLGIKYSFVQNFYILRFCSN